MVLTCPDPNFPVKVGKYVLTDGGFGASADDGAPNWLFDAGFLNSGGTVIGIAAKNGSNFWQKSADFSIPYGSGDNEIQPGELYICEFGLTNVSIVQEGVHAQIRPIWGAVGETITASNGIKRQTFTTPGSGSDFRLAIRAGPGFYGHITHCYLFTFRCIASSEVETGGSGGDIGSGDGDVSGGVGGIILQAGETPNTGFSSKFDEEDKDSFGGQ